AGDGPCRVRLPPRCRDEAAGSRPTRRPPPLRRGRPALRHRADLRRPRVPDRLPSVRPFRDRNPPPARRPPRLPRRARRRPLPRAPGCVLGSEKSRDGLLCRRPEYARQHPAHRVTLFYDGKQTWVQTSGGVELRVTSGRRTAGDVIVDFLKDLPSGDLPRTTLVTDDRGLAERAGAQGVTVEGVAWLRGRLARQAAAQHGRG